MFRVACACLLLMAGVFAADTSSSSSDGGSGGSDSGQEFDPNDDVSMGTCTTDSLGSPEATVEITNNSPKTSNYVVEVVFEGSGGATQIDSSIAAVNNLEPGQSTSEKAVSFKEATGDFTCRIKDVTRYAS